MALFSKKSNTEVEKKETAASTPIASPGLKDLPFVLLQPRISEKSGKLAVINKYVFLVKPKTNKLEVRKAVEAKYKVKVLRVNIVNNQGKIKSFGGRKGKTSGLKKAIVTLKKGDKIQGLTDAV